MTRDMRGRAEIVSGDDDFILRFHRREGRNGRHETDPERARSWPVASDMEPPRDIRDVSIAHHPAKAAISPSLTAPPWTSSIAASKMSIPRSMSSSDNVNGGVNSRMLEKRPT